jgi:hypothetical protein
MGSGKVALDIERLLQWAYREELPKGYREGHGARAYSGPIFRMAALGVEVDESREPGFPLALGPPHPAALTIENVVDGLEDMRLDWRAARTLILGELAPYVTDNHPRLSHVFFEVGSLIALHARMGNRPVWDLGPVRLTRINNKGNNKPVVQYLADDGALIDGRTNGRHYGPMARCPLQLEPAGAEIAFARAEYIAWHAGLMKVHHIIRAWNLPDYASLPPRARPEPWITGEEPKSRVLPSLLACR